MKKQIIAVICMLLSINSMAQRDEIRAIERAVKKGDYKTALYAINAAEDVLSNADARYKSNFLFLKGQTLTAKKDYKRAAKTFNELIAFEKKIGKERYTSKAEPMIRTMIKEVNDKAVDLYNNKKDYKAASESFYLTYLLSPRDTSSVYNAAISSTQAEDYDTALKYYIELKNLGYTGIAKQYIATSKANGKPQLFGSKKERDTSVKLGLSTNPKDEISESKEATIVKNIALILIKQGKTEEARKAIKEARKANPKDINLILNEADLYVKLKEMDKFGELMQEAVKLDPNNPNLYYNLGVVNANQNRTEEAIKYYKKAIELRPDYADAYMNLAASILSKERPIVEEMNKNLSNFKKYDELATKQKGVYKEALPYLIKADELNRSEASVRTLKNIYEVLEMKDEAKKYNELHKSMK